LKTPLTCCRSLEMTESSVCESVDLDGLKYMLLQENHCADVCFLGQCRSCQGDEGMCLSACACSMVLLVQPLFVDT
jgi:hypothetical protein